MAKVKKISLFDRALNKIEVVGNKLPNPATIFIILAGLVLVLSFVLSLFNVSVKDISGEQIEIVNLLSVEELKNILTNIVKNFQGFAPLGLVLVVMLGAGVAEKSGLMAVLMKMAVLKVPVKWLTIMVFLMAMFSHMAGDAGFIILPPLAAILFLSAGRHPLIGLFAAYAGCAGAFSANFIVTMNDVTLTAFTNEAILSMKGKEELVISPAANLIFMLISTFILTAGGTWVTEKVITPRFSGESLDQFQSVDGEDQSNLDPKERKAAMSALKSAGIYLIFIFLLAVIPLGPDGVPFLAAKVVDEATGQTSVSLLAASAPLMAGIVPLMLFLFLIPGIVYGKKVGIIKNDHDVVHLMAKSIADMSSYIVLAFAASQFIELFKISNIGTILSISGANGIEAIGLSGAPLFIAFIIFSAFINIFIGSASAKWALLAPIFVPMFIYLGYDPAIIQTAYRIGDSITSPITPLFPYFPLLLGFAAQWRKDIGIGTVISNMIPYSIVFAILWIGLFVIFFVLGLPVGF